MKRILTFCIIILAAVFLLTDPVSAQADSDYWGDSDPVVESPDHGIPLLVIHIDEHELHQSKKGNWYGTIADMNDSPDHSVRCEGSVEFLIQEEGFLSEFGGSAPAGSLELDYIRGRGNSTWKSDAKRPYKIQLKAPVDLFGMGESREWALIANAKDPTLLKNRLTSWLGSSLGLSYTPQMVPVDVVMIGSECGRIDLGSYCLSEHVEIGPSRLAIDKLGKDVVSEQGDINLTGGYLLSIYNLQQNSDEPKGNVFTLSNGLKLIHEDPSFKDESSISDGQRAQREYIQDYVLHIDDLIMNSASIDEETHQELSSLLDLQSAADYWLIQEFSQNTDAYDTSSTYLYKERDGKLFFGPLWDFDLAWGDPQFTYFYEQSTTGFNFTKFVWIDELRAKDPYFVELIEHEWNKLNPLLESAVQNGGVLDQYQNELERSRQADYALWAQAESIEIEDYGELISNLKNWISLRKTWVHNNQDELPETHVIYTFKTPEGENLSQLRVRKGDRLSDAADPPERDGYIFIGWFEESSHTELKKYTAEHNTVFVAEYLDEDLAILPEALYFRNYELWIPLGEVLPVNYETAIWPENVSNSRIRWTSSNPDVVAWADGLPYAVGVGEATVTGTLHNGVSASCIMHVYNPQVTQKEAVSGVRVIPEEAELVPGQMIQVHGILLPEGRPLASSPYITVSSSDPDVAEIRTCGLLNTVCLVKAREEGTAILTISAEDPDSGTVYTASCTVTVGQPTELKLPEDLSVIEEEAFRGTAPNKVIIPDQVTSIGAKAFAYNKDLYSVLVYSRELTIAPDAFAHSLNLTVYGYAGTAIDAYCSEKGIPFVPLL